MESRKFMQFTSSYKEILLLFGNNVKYVIPSYQRPYSWECYDISDKTNQVNVLWDDLVGYFESGTENHYFLGSMVMRQIDDREFEVIDGQQRLTTILLMLAGIRAILDKNFILGGDSDSTRKEVLSKFVDELHREIDDRLFNRTPRSPTFVSDKKVLIQWMAGFDFDKVLNAALLGRDIEMIEIPKGTNAEVLKVVRRYFTNRDYFAKQAREYFTVSGRWDQSTLDHLDAFLIFLRQKVGIIQIVAPNRDAAFQAYEVLNNRGLPLSNLDLLRNLIVREFNAFSGHAGHDNGAKLWHELECENNLDSSFVSRFVESRKAGKQRFSAYNDLEENYEKKYAPGLGRSKIQNFFRDVEIDALNFAKIRNFGLNSRLLNNKVRFLSEIGTAWNNTQNFLMALLRANQEERQLVKWVSAYEKCMLVEYFIFGRSKIDDLFEVIDKLNRGNFSEAFEILDIKDERLAMLKDEIADGDFSKNHLGRLLLMKYQLAWDSQSSDKDVVEFIPKFDGVTLEHIIPQKVTKNTNWAKDFSPGFRKEFTSKLGNFTLLTSSMNSAAKNYDFSKKQEIYKKTRLPLTQEMCGSGFQMNEAFIRERHTRICKVILEDLGL